MKRWVGYLSYLSLCFLLFIKSLKCYNKDKHSLYRLKSFYCRRNISKFIYYAPCSIFLCLHSQFCIHYINTLTGSHSFYIWPKMTWKQLTERDRREWKLSAVDPHDRDTWRSGVRSAMRAASHLPGRGPTVVDMAPIPAG